ncbi:MAG: hypothetical protein M0R80_00540 [Proteobacteria bacterium]|nr:hypothetical protein [Pseudomonadota bacterium]
MNFREYIFREYIEAKPWKAKRADIIKFWQGLRPNMPLRPTPVNKQHKGTKFREDGLRITGSPDFINGVLSRLKDLLQYDTFPGTKLEIEYRQIGQEQGLPVYVCYLHVIDRKS